MRTRYAWRCAASGVLASAVLCWAAKARADDAQQFELLKGLFYAGQYEEVVQRVTILLDPSNPACATVEGAPTALQTCHIGDGVLQERLREMHIVALFGLKKQADADAVIEKLLRQNPAYSPEPGALPATVVERVREVKGRLQKELEDEARRRADEQRKNLLMGQKVAEEEKKWIEQLSKLAASETVIEKRSRVLTFVPFGVGQFQNGDTTLGTVFLATEALAAGAAIGFGAAHGFYAAVDPNGKDPVTGRPVVLSELRQLVQVTALGNQIAFATWAALAVAGIVQANIAFVPEVRSVRERPIPKRPTVVVAPTAAPTTGGLTVGVVGTF
ncbi:MAG: hypothetical protein IPK82_40380 [Polyangiaceae bacterium]|nr:hypothetical protein [Polyangiaceae bacterium]